MSDKFFLSSEDSSFSSNIFDSGDESNLDLIPELMRHDDPRGDAHFSYSSDSKGFPSDNVWTFSTSDDDFKQK